MAWVVEEATTGQQDPSGREKWLRVADAASLLGVSPNTLRRAGTYRDLDCYRSPGGHRRYKRDDVEVFLTSRRDGATAAGRGRSAQASTGEVEMLRRKVDDLGALVDANLEVTARFAHGSDEVLRTIARRLCDLTGAPECEVSRLDGDELVGLVRFADGACDRSWEGTHTSLAEVSFSATTVRTGRPGVATGLDDERLGPALRESLAQWGYEACLTLPMKLHGRVVGLVELMDGSPRDFHLGLEVAGSLAQTAAHALENAQLVQRVERQNAALGELVAIGALIGGSRDPRGMAGAVAQRVREVTGAALCGIYAIADDELRGLALWEESGRWAPGDDWCQPLSALSFTAAAVAARRPMVVTDPADRRLSRLEREPFARNGFTSEISVPLVVEDRIVGLIDLFSREKTDWGDDLDFLRSVGQLVAGALDKALLLDELERQNALLRDLVDVGAVSTRASDASGALRAMAQRVMRVMGVENCEIYSLVDERIHLVAGYDTGGFADQWEGWSAALSEFPATAGAVSGQTVFVASDLDCPTYTEHERELMRRFGLRSEICVPLAIDDRVVGIIDVHDTRPRDFAEHVGFLHGVAPLVARALENALLVERLHERTRELDYLVDSGLEFGASLDLERVLTSTAERMAELAGATGCDLYRLEDGVVHNVMSVKNGGVNAGYIGSSFAVRDYAYWSTAIAERRPVFAEDILSDPDASEADRAAAVRWEYRAALDLPLVAGGEAIGLAELFSTEPFTFRNADLLRAVSQVAAQAIANASLYSERDRNARRLELVSTQSLELSATLDLDAVVAAAARSLRESGGFTDCDVFMIEGDELVCVASVVGAEEFPDWIGRRLSLGEWTTDRLAVETRETVIIESPDDLRMGPAERAVREEYDEQSVVIVPLIAKERVIALVELIDKGRTRAYDAELLATVEALSRVAGLALDNAELYSDIKGMHLSNLKALSSALNAKDYYTLGHAARVAAYMVLLGKELGWAPDFVQHVEEAAYLHDIGKIGVSDRVLLKPGGLNTHEWELMRQHPMFSADIIRPLFDDALVDGVRHHHERYDGAGYPDGLTGRAIPEIARAMCVADSYDAMSFRRPYRQALTYEECVAELRRCSGTQFDPRIVEAFVCVLRRLRQRKRRAVAVAEEGAARLDAATHASFDSAEATETSAFAATVAALRKVRDANPPTRYLGTRARLEGSFVIVADVGEDGDQPTPFGTEVFADDELPEAFAGATLDTVVLYVDEFGVWVSGLAPVRADDGTVVAVVAADMPPPGTDEGEMEGLRSDVTQTFASMLRSAAARLGRAEIEAITDGLTGLYNHRYLHERLDEEVERARAEGLPLSLLLCDIDRFKVFNDEFGHSAGDEALRIVARVIETSIRHVDLAARYGGGEFAVILVGTSGEGALEVAERLRTGVSEAHAGFEAGALRVSVGAATFPQDAGTKPELLDKADWAMYLAKRQGRDRVLSFRRKGDERG